MISNKVNPQLHENLTQSILEKQEGTRSWIAKGFSILFALIIVGVLLFFMFADNSQDKEKSVLAVISGITGIFGFILGFYFGQNPSKS